jgi:hypothetical protein
MSTEYTREPISISNNIFHPLEVELMNFRYMSNKYVVSLIHPGNAATHSSTRLVNLSPQTALNLLAWLEQERETLQHLAQQQAINETQKDQSQPTE